MEGNRSAECDRASETSSFVEDDEEEEEEEEEEEDEDEEDVDPEEAEELTNSLKDVIQNEDVKPKLQYIMTNPSFSMVTVQSEDSGITWETSSSRCSTPWASETSMTSDLYSMESSPVGSPPGKVIFIMDEGKIVRKRKRKSSNRVPMATRLKGGLGSKKRDSSGRQRQEPRTVLGDVQATVLNVEQMEVQDTDEEMLDDEEDLENIAEEPVKRAPIRSIFRESRLRKVGPILGGPVQARIQLFNSIFGGTEPAPETSEKTRIQRSNSVSGDSEQFLETSVKERLQMFSSLSEATHPKPFQTARSRNLQTPSERRREQRQQSTAQANQSYSSPTRPLENWLTNKGGISSENIKPIKTKDKPSRFSHFGAETTLQHEERKDRQSFLEAPDQVPGHSLKSCPPEEGRKQQSYSPADKMLITEQTTSVSLESDDKSEKQAPLLSAENANKKTDQSLLTASDHLEEPEEQEIQPSAASQSVSADLVNELERQGTQSTLPIASMSDHPGREAQKSAVQSYLPSAPSAKSKYSTLSETRQEDIIPQSSGTAQAESEYMLLPHSEDETEKQETECQPPVTALPESEPSGLLYSSKKKEDQKIPPLEIQNVHLEKQTKSKQDFSSSLQETEEQGIALNTPISEKIDSKYLGVSYPTHTETEETEKTPATNKAVDLDHPDFPIETNEQAEGVQMEMEHPDFSYPSKEIRESERTQMETEHLGFSFSKEETEELEGAQIEMEHPDFSFSREEMEEPKSAQLEMEHPAFSYAREEMEELESAQLETKHTDFLYSREEAVESESAELEAEYPELLFSMKETEELESAQLETKWSDFSYSIKETEESESSQLEKERPDFFPKKETEESESVQLKMEHPDFSYSGEEMVESESAQLQTEYPDFSFSREEMEESESVQLETEHPDFSYSREEMVESESAQLETEYPDFSFSREEVEGAQLEMEHEGFSLSREETKKQTRVPFELEQPESYSPEEAEQEKTAPLAPVPSDLSCLMEKAEKENTTEFQWSVHPDIFDSMRRAETEQTGYQETAHSDLLYNMNKTKQQKLAQTDLDNSLMSDFSDKGQQLQPVQQHSQPGDKLYSCPKGVQGETTPLQSEHPVLSYSTGEEQQHKFSQLRAEQPETLNRTGKTEQQKVLQPKLEQADSPYSQGETAQEAVQGDLEGPEPSCFVSEAEQRENVQPASENRDFSFTTGEVMQKGVESGSLGSLHLIDRAKPWEMSQTEQEQSLDSCSAAGSHQQEAPPLDMVQPDRSYSFGRMEQQDIVEREMEQQETAQQKAKQTGMVCSDLSETWEKEEPLVTDQINLVHQEIAQPELVHPSLPYSFSEQMQEEMQTEPAYPEQTFYVSTEMQEEMTHRKSEQAFLSCFTSKTEQQEIIHPKQEQIFLPSSTGKEAPLEKEMSSEYPDTSYFLHETEQQKKMKHPTLPLMKHPTLPLTKRPDFSCDSGETKPGDIIEQESGHPELSYSMGETQQQLEHLDSSGNLDEAVQDESMEVESKCPDLSDVQRNQQQTSQLDSKYPDSSFTFGKAKEQATQDFESKYQELPKVAQKRPSAAQIESKHPDLTYCPGKANEPETATWEMKHPDLSHSTETNYQEVVVLDKKHRKVSVGRENQQQTTKQQIEQEKLSLSPGKTEQFKHAQEDLEQPDLSFSFHRPDDEMAPPEAEHTDVIYPLENTEVQQRVQQETEQTYPFGKAEQKTVQWEVEIPDLAHSVGIAAAAEETAEPWQRHSDLPYSDLKVGGLQSEKLKPEHPGLACSLDKVQEMNKQKLEQSGALDVHDKTEQIPPAQLELGHAHVASPANKVGQRGMQHSASGCPSEEQSASRARHPQAAEEKLGALEASSHGGKAEEREMTKPEPKHPDLSYSIDKTQTEETTRLVLGKSGLPSWPGRTEQAQTAQEEQPGFLLSSKKAAQGKKAQPGLGHSQLPHSVSEAEQEAALAKSSCSDLTAGRSERREVIQPETEIMDLSSSTGKTQQPQIAEVDLVYPDLLHSSGKVQQQEKFPPEQEQPGDFSSSLSKEEQWEGVGMQTEHPELQCSMGKTEGLQNSQAKSEYANLSFPVDTAETRKTTQAKLKEDNLLHMSVETKPSWPAPLESEHPDVSDAMGKVLHPGVSCAFSEEKTSAHLEVKQERGSYTLHPEEIVHLKLEQTMFSSSHGTAEQPHRATLEGEFPDFLYSSGKKEQQEMAKLESEHSDLSYSTDETQQQETTKLGLGLPELSCPEETEQPQIAQVEAEHQDLLHFTGKRAWRGTAQPEVEQPDSSYSSDQAGQPLATQRISKQPVTPYPIGKTEQQGRARPERELPGLSYAICKTLSQEATQMDLGVQDLTYALGKTDEMQTAQGGLEHTGSLYSSDKREEEMTLPALQHLQLSYPVREVEEETIYQKSNYPDLSYSIVQQKHHETEQPEVEEMDLSYPTGKSEHSQPAQDLLQQPELKESFSQLEEKRMAQPGFLHSIGEEKQKPASQLELVQPGLSHLLGEREKQEMARARFMPSDFSYSTGKSEQLQPEQLKSKHLDLSYSLGKAQTHGMKPPDLLYSYGKAEQSQTAQLEHLQTLPFTGETERGDGAQAEQQCINLQSSVVETEQPETPSVSHTFGRPEEQGTTQLDFEQSDLLIPTDKAEKHDLALLRAGRSEKRGSGATSSPIAQMETEQQELSFSTEEAESQKIQPYSSPTEQTLSVPVGVSHSVSETKSERGPKSPPVTGSLLPKHLELSEQSETSQSESGFLARKEAENKKSHIHLPVAAQSEAEHIILPETEREQTPQYFHTAIQLESEQLNLSYSTDKAETLESQDYLSLPSKTEFESSVPFYSADETCQQEIPPYSKPASEYLVPTLSLAEQEKQSMQAQSTQSECKHVIPPHDEKELQKIQLPSPKTTSLKTVQLESVSLMHTQDQDKQESQDHLLDTKYLSSEQRRNPSRFTTEQDNQEMQPDVGTMPRSVTTESKMTAVAGQQAVSSDSFLPFHTLPEQPVSVAFIDNEEKQNIPSSLSDIVGMFGKQSNIVSGIYFKGEDRCKTQQDFADQNHTSLESVGAVSSDVVYETVTHKTQHHSSEQGSLSSAEMKSVISSSDQEENPDIPSLALASWLTEEVEARSISPIRAAEASRQGVQLSASEASDFGSKQFPAGSFTELAVHGATKNKDHMFRASDSVSSKISHEMSSDSRNRTQRYNLPALVGDNPGPDKVSEHETSSGNPQKMEATQHPEVDNVSEVPEHYLRGEEEEMEHASAVEGTQHAPETTEQKDIFNIISEGYEILNIHASTHIFSVDEEESKHMVDKLEYLETNPSYKRKSADDGHRALASGTITEISESSLLGKPASDELKELIKNDDVEETGETQQENPVLPENDNNVVLDPNNGMADMDYFEKYTLIDDKSPVKPHFERPSSLFSVTEVPHEPVEEATTFKESTEADTLEEEFSLLEDLDEVFYGTVKGESKMQSYADSPKPLPLQKPIDISSKKVTNVEDEQKSPGTPLFDSEEGVLERSLLFPTTVAAVNPELLEEPPALSFLYKDLYAEAVGEKTKDGTPSDEESGNSNASFPSRNSDTDDGTGMYFEKYILKDEIPSKAIGPQKYQIPEDESFTGGISVQSSQDKQKQGSGDLQCVRTEVLPERGVVERKKVQVDCNIQATICKPMHAIPFGSKVIPSGAATDTTEQREEENVPVETTEELPDQSSQQAYSQLVDYQRAAYQEAGNKQEEQHDITAVPQMEKYVPYVRTPVEDSEDDQYTQENLSCIPTIQQTEKPDLQREEHHSDIYEDLAESMDYDVITQEELLQDEISSQLTHEELLFEDRDSFEHAGDSYEFVNEPEQRTPVELEDSGFVVMYPEKSATNIPQVESPQRELKKAQADTYCYHCKCPISAIDKLFGEHKDHEVTTLDDAANKMKNQLNELLIAVEEKSMKIEEFVGDIELLFNSVEENCKKNAELLEKQNEDMLKKVVAQYDEKSENFEEVKKMKMEYLYEQMVNFQQTVDSAKETLETTAKEMEELDGFVFLNSSKEFNKRLLSAMDNTLSLEKVPSAFSLFEHYADSPGQSNQHSLKHVAVPQTPTVIPQEPNSATSTSIAVYWAVNDGDAIDCFQVYCMEELQASKDAGALVEEYRVTVKESHCILEDLEPDCCYSVWVMAVNGTGCSLPSEKAIFKTAPTVPTIKAEDCTVCWDMATVRWHAGSASAESFILEYCRQHSPEGEGLRSFAGIKRPELKVSLEPNVNYFFYLKAVNPFGTSEQSEAALISTKGTRFHLLSNTAHPALQISSNATVICLPEKTKFMGFPSVLGELLPARGRHYWEIVVTACRSYRIGICYKAVPQSSILGLSDTSWCMLCCPTQTSFLYRFLHTGVMSDVHVTEHPTRIGILLDYSGGRLLFFNAERELVLFAIRHKFTDAAHPAFALEKAGMLTLCTGMELPEFVKNS
ncbi:cardiomyopathy-associated protein 5 [Falco peregrinus]|uniref:cardiomyopathy-associated protein 5 n=1 Tax=Falco peregrinus TaxID=8954 RepID=UPI002479014C|nr:cardiomyopathy-associated protein 5 [Falco peregrinus]